MSHSNLAIVWKNSNKKEQLYFGADCIWTPWYVFIYISTSPISLPTKSNGIWWHDSWLFQLNHLQHYSVNNCKRCGIMYDRRVYPICMVVCMREHWVELTRNKYTESKRRWSAPTLFWTYWSVHGLIYCNPDILPVCWLNWNKYSGCD